MSGPSGSPDPGRAAAALAEAFGARPDVAVVLGSGLGRVVDGLAHPVAVRFDELPGFPPTAVAGHGGRFVCGAWEGRRVVIQEGRYHAYEGHPDDVVLGPVRAAAALGVRCLVVTNAVGGIHPALGPGSLVLLRDHLNVAFRHPLAGPQRPGESRFPDMSAPYDAALGELALGIAREEGVELREGVYGGVLGPSYETPAEVRMLRRMGADVVGMSTVPEVTAAAALGLRCVGLSVVTNRASGLSAGPLTHEEVVAAAREAGGRLGRLVRLLVARLPREGAPQSTGAK